MPFPNVTGYVLAGGQSSRMGQDKAFLRFHGQELVGIAVDCLSSLCSQVRILSGPPCYEREADLACYAPVVPDRSQHCGPLGGVDAALTDAATDWLLVIAVDQVLLSPALLEPWLGAALAAGGLASFLSLDGKPQPLPLLLRKELQHGVEERLRQGDRKLLRTLQNIILQEHGRVFEHPVLPSPEGLHSLVNLNTPQDVVTVEAVGSARGRSNQSDPGASE